MAIEVFNRHENKYLLDRETFFHIQTRLSDYMELDDYNWNHATYPIWNLYYDTADSHLIRTSLSKPKYKEKLRLRAYGPADAGSEVYVEIKKKVAGLVNKRRTAMRLAEAYSFLETGEMPLLSPEMNAQVIHEIAYLLERNSLAPALLLCYDRRAYFGQGQHDLRVSFDTNIRTRRTDLCFEAGSFGSPLLPEGAWLMEIKVAQSIPVWLCRLLSEYRIYPTSFSKYGTEYCQQLNRNSAPRVFVPWPEKALQPFPALASAY